MVSTVNSQLEDPGVDRVLFCVEFCMFSSCLHVHDMNVRSIDHSEFSEGVNLCVHGKTAGIGSHNPYKDKVAWKMND